MAGPLSLCTKEEQLSLIWFLWPEGVSGNCLVRTILCMHVMLLLGRQVTGDEVANGLQISHGSVCEIIPSPMMKQGFVIASQRVNIRVWDGNIHNCPARKSSKANHPQGNGCLQFWGLTNASTGTLSEEGDNNKKCSLQ
jgi:hypothetical protein